MMIHEVTQIAGAHKRRKRIGRGVGSGHGKTAGRGHKGAGSRAGYSHRAAHEGGQMPLFRRIPKRGFGNSMFMTQYAIVNIQALDARFDDGQDVNGESLCKVGLIRNAKLKVKVLGQGETTKKLTVTASAFSASARDKITKAGGSATVA